MSNNDLSHSGARVSANPESIPPQTRRCDGFRARSLCSRPGMTTAKRASQTHPFLPAARFLGPGSAKRRPSFKEGAGNAGRTNAPAASRAGKRSTQAKSPQVHRKRPGISRTMVLRFPSCSPRRPGFLSPSPARSSTRGLDISVGISGPHDFAVRADAFRQEHHCVHRIPRPTFVTIGQTPLLVEAGRGELLKVICPTT